jgi:hypothetical protein
MPGFIHAIQFLLLNTPAQRRSRYDRELMRLHREIGEQSRVIRELQAQKSLLEMQALELERLALFDVAQAR